MTGEYIDYYNDNCTVAVVVGTTFPITGAFEFSFVFDDVAASNPLATSTDLLALRDYDNRLYARSARKPIEVPFLPNTDIDAEIDISDDFARTGRSEFTFWHGLLNFPQIQKWEFVHVNTGEHTWVYVGDTITIVYANGWTEKLKLTTPQGSIAFTRVPGTLRDENGRVPGSDTSTVSPSDSGNSVGFVDSFGVDHYSVPVVYHAPGSRIERHGVVHIRQIVPSLGGPFEIHFLE